MAVFSQAAVLLIATLFALLATHTSASSEWQNDANFFKCCRLPVHGLFSSHHLAMQDSHTAGHACIRYRSSRSLGFGSGPMVVPLKCARDGEGIARTSLAPQALSRCKKELNITTSAESSRACKLNQDLAAGFKLAGQTAKGDASSESFDGIYVTHESYVCEEKFGTAQLDTPKVQLFQCREGVLMNAEELLSEGWKIGSQSRYSCKDIVVSYIGGKQP